MTCDSCGQKMDPFGDDGMDDTGIASMHIVPGNGTRILRAMDDGAVIKVKASCPNCGHIQYGCRPKASIGN
jgi:hypothetical protein